MRLRTLALIATLTPFTFGSAPALAGLTGLTVEAVSYFNVADPPPAPTSLTATDPTPDCKVILCSILNYPLPPPPANNSQNWPPPTAPVSYLEDSLTNQIVTISDTKITIVNNYDGKFCWITGCDGPFSGFGFYFSSSADITNVTVDSSSASSMGPIGLSFTGTTILVNLNGLNPAVGDTLVLDITTGGGGGGGGGTVPEPSTWAMMVLGFAGLGFAGWRRTARAT